MHKQRTIGTLESSTSATSPQQEAGGSSASMMLPVQQALAGAFAGLALPPASCCGLGSGGVLVLDPNLGGGANNSLAQWSQLALSNTLLVNKMSWLFNAIAQKFCMQQSVCLCQAWILVGEADVSTAPDFALFSPEPLAVVGDPLFQQLRQRSCQQPVFFRNSMPGKVWKSGNLQIVQNVKILPPTLHPRSQLTDEALDRLAEALYIPVYDMAWPLKGQVSILEVLLSNRATETMLAADFISFIGNVLTTLQLSISNPVPQPIRRSVLCGRRPRAPDSDDEAEQQPKQQATAAVAPGARQAPVHPAMLPPARSSANGAAAPSQQASGDVAACGAAAMLKPCAPEQREGAAAAAMSAGTPIPAASPPPTESMGADVRGAPTDGDGGLAQGAGSIAAGAADAAAEATSQQQGPHDEAQRCDATHRPRRKVRREEGAHQGVPRNKSMQSVPAAASST